MGTVEVNIRSARAAWRKAGYGEFSVRFKQAGGGTCTTADVQDGVDAANATFEAHDEAARARGDHGAGEGGDFLGSSAVASPRGWVVFLSRAYGEPADLERWLNAFATHLGRAGFDGEVAGARAVYQPDWPYDSGRPWHMTAFVAYDTRDMPLRLDNGPSLWATPPEVTQALVGAAVPWAHAGAKATYLSLGMFNLKMARPKSAAEEAVALAAATDMLAAGLPEQGQGGIDGYNEDERRVAHASFSWQGYGVYSLSDPSLGTRAELKSLYDLVLKNLEHVDLAMFRWARPQPLSWNVLTSTEPPTTREQNYWTRDHQQRNQVRDHVPAPSGLQIVTSRHLERAHDLSAWRTKPLGHDRYLLAADSFEAWFSGTVAEERLARADADFGDMVYVDSRYSSR